MLIATERLRGEVLFSNQEVIDKIGEFAITSAAHLRNLRPVMVPMYRGAGEFIDELTKQWRHLDDPFTPPIVPIWVSRYDNGEARVPRIERHIQANISGRVAVIADEIIEGGESMDLVEKNLRQRGAVAIKRIVLMKRLSGTGRVDHHVLELDGDEWVNGWGADQGDGTGREPEDIIVSLRQPGDL